MKVASYNDRLAVWELIVEPVEIEGKHRPWEIFLKVILHFVCFSVNILIVLLLAFPTELGFCGFFIEYEKCEL